MQTTTSNPHNAIARTDPEADVHRGRFVAVSRCCHEISAIQSLCVPHGAYDLKPPKLRVARPTDRIHETVRFYVEGLGFEVLASFEDHDGFDGVIVGYRNAPYHLEFTHKRGHRVGEAPTQDNLLVFYLPLEEEWRAQIERMQANGYKEVVSFNPYWDEHGATFEDPDGYRIVIARLDWSL